MNYHNKIKNLVIVCNEVLSIYPNTKSITIYIKVKPETAMCLHGYI